MFQNIDIEILTNTFGLSGGPFGQAGISEEGFADDDGVGVNLYSGPVNANAMGMIFIPAGSLGSSPVVKCIASVIRAALVGAAVLTAALASGAICALPIVGEVACIAITTIIMSLAYDVVKEYTTSATQDCATYGS